MNLIKDIKEIFNDSKFMNIRIEISNIEIRVYVNDDPYNDCKKATEYCVVYDVMDDNSYVDIKSFTNMYYFDGLYFEEDIKYIYKLMKYFDNNSKEIMETVNGLAWEKR